jgi:hypothetical protein
VTLLLAGLLWTVIFVGIDTMFYRMFGLTTLNRSHHLTFHGVKYITEHTYKNTFLSSLAGNAAQTAETLKGLDRTQHQFMHLLALYCHRVLLYYPAVGSFYMAIFNGMRRHHLTLEWHDFFSCFSLPELFRMSGIGTVLFLLSFITSLRLLMLPLYVYMMVVTMYAIPLHVEQRHLSIAEVLRYSMKTVHGQFGNILFFLIYCVIVQVIGLLCFVVGIYVAFPVAHAAIAYSYHHLLGVNGVKRDMQPMPLYD